MCFWCSNWRYIWIVSGSGLAPNVPKETIWTMLNKLHDAVFKGTGKPRETYILIWYQLNLITKTLYTSRQLHRIIMCKVLYLWDTPGWDLQW